jgi:hypothetical protein
MRRLLLMVSAASALGLAVVGATAGPSAAAPRAAAPRTARPGSAVPTHIGLPMIRDVMHKISHEPYPVISLNWSGYAVTPTATSKKFTYANTTFVQPAIKCTGTPDLGTSDWVGLDGFDNQTVEQDGTLAICGGKGNKTPEYFAWYEMFPASLTTVFTVKPGDTITGSVKYASGKFTLTIADTTSKKSKTDTATCSTCARASAEWINERFAECNKSGTKCFLIPLADFTTATLSDDLASEGGKNMGISAFPFGSSFPIDMVYNLNGTESVGPKGFESLDNTGTVTTKSESFTVDWERSGKATPITLSPKG